MRSIKDANTTLHKLVDLFIKGDVPNAIAKIVLSCPNMPSSKWTLSNRLLAFVQCLEIDCRGFRQWQSVSRKVKKGARAVHILAPILIKRIDEESGEEKQTIIGFRRLPVFPLSSTTGKAIPELTPKTAPSLLNVAEKLNLKIEYQSFAGPFYGAYSPDNNKIILCTHDEQTFFHELAHAAHHKLIGNELKTGQDAKQEIIAEMTACVLARMYGRKSSNDGSTYAYIKRYAAELNKSVEDAIIPLLSEIESVLSLVVSASNEPAITNLNSGTQTESIAA